MLVISYTTLLNCLSPLFVLSHISADLSNIHYDKYHNYSSVRVIASRILHEICLLVGELAIRGTKLTLNARLGTKGNLLIEQYNIAIRAIAIRRTPLYI